MLFNSFHFLLFFPVVTILYFVLPHRYRWLLILSASCYFYMAFIPKYILILAVTIAVDYAAGLGLERLHGRKRKFLLVASILTNIGMLAFFKYFNFANENLAALSNFIGWNYPIQNLEIILPIGLSFHTFQSLSYTIEVYRGRQKAERHLGYLALYVMFYPQLVAGPIERPQNILHQLHTEHKFDYERVTDGLKWMAWGMFKKVVVADRMALFVNPVYDAPGEYSGPALVMATLAFAIQIYCDFSGYSDIALGSAQVMGIKLMKNFDHPYFSRSISEFWRRWHISLSTWFRDYVYIPLGGNRVARSRWVFNLLLTFTVSGLWHGANWTFLIWGALHGVYVVLFGLTENFWDWVSRTIRLDAFPKFKDSIGILSTFMLVSFAWVFFRANNIHDAIYIVSHFFTGWKDYLLEIGSAIRSDAANLTLFDRLFPLFALSLKWIPRGTIFFSGIALLILAIIEAKQYRGEFMVQFNRSPVYIRWACYVVLVTLTLILGTAYTGSEQAFIYFQF
ncbi:MAG: MBOAT family O-acyltransferase [Chloroflexota bacterium]